MEDQKKLRERITEMNDTAMKQQKNLELTISRLESQTEGLVEARKRIRKLELECDMLLKTKCDLADFQKNIDRINTHMREEDIMMIRIDNHCLSLDQYLDKYLPVRIQ